VQSNEAPGQGLEVTSGTVTKMLQRVYLVTLSRRAYFKTATRFRGTRVKVISFTLVRKHADFHETHKFSIYYTIHCHFPILYNVTGIVDVYFLRILPHKDRRLDTSLQGNVHVQRCAQIIWIDLLFLLNNKYRNINNWSRSMEEP
jgi:hypothetical protein